MDLARAIADRTNRLAEIEREAAIVREELEALHKAASILGVSPPKAADVEQAPSRRGGKPQGAISNRWRETLRDLLPTTARHPLSHVQLAAEKHGSGAEMHSVRDRVRKFVEAGYLIRNSDDTVSVTEAAVIKFRLSQKEVSASPEEEEAGNS